MQFRRKEGSAEARALIPRPGRTLRRREPIGRGRPVGVGGLRGACGLGLAREAGELGLRRVRRFSSRRGVGGLLRVTRTASPAPRQGVPGARGTRGGRGIARPGRRAPLWGPRVAPSGPGPRLG